MRQTTRTDQLISQFDRALRTLGAPRAQQTRPTPSTASKNTLNAVERKHAAGLMRINHAGEVAAQALYFGHATAAKSQTTQAMMLAAASEEADHLAWCADRLQALDSRPSLFGPLWYGGAFAMGYLSAKAGDKVALGFVAETERQVEAHLANHERALPASDFASLEVLANMRADEAKHGAAALQAGGIKLAWPLPQLMAKTADVMRCVAYRI
jgi:3-demethoxyubiquinol 3-hydroxylase